MTDDTTTLPPDLLERLAEAWFRSNDGAARTAALAAIAADHQEHAAAIAAWARTFEQPDRGAPSAIGPFTILDRLGEGGFGVVWLAEQREPVRRRVALKVLKPGMDSTAVLARFAREQDALARMNHDAIARIHDAGTSERGQPWFAMELVDGEPITTFCQRRGLGLRDRLGLFQQVCHGVQHAHQKGVLHRDLKPPNVLVADVGGQPRAKIIDFGVARALDQDRGATLLTEQGMLVGTPEYMAPEQIAGDAARIDTRTDVHALGVLLYELLTGSLPFPSERLRALPFAEMVHLLRTAEPERPSARARQTAAGAVATTWHRLLRGDLDWIVLRALAREPERRYPSAAALADDLERYLANDPVQAGPPTASYRLQKLLQRYRGQFVAAGLVLLVAVIGAVVAMAWAREAEQLGLLAERRAAALADKVDEFDQLAGVVMHERALATERTLYPAWPAQAAALRDWLQRDCAPLLALQPRLQATLRELEQRALPRTATDVEADRRADPRHDDVVDLQQRIAALERSETLAATVLPVQKAAGGLIDAIVRGWAQRDGGKATAEEGQTHAEMTAQALAGVQATRQRLQQELAALLAEIDGRRSFRFEDPSATFLHAALRDLDRRVAAMAAEVRPRVVRRLRWAEAVAAAHPRAPLTWQQVDEQLAAAQRKGSDSPYEGTSVRLSPQTGLVPLGRNPATRLFEFYDLISAWDGEMDPAAIPLPIVGSDGSIAVNDETGIVFVLLPGGRSWLGAQPDDPQGPNHDPAAEPGLGVHQVQLRPFLLAKHELTQAQWRRLAALTGAAPMPSYYAMGSKIGALTFTGVHPVEMVSWQQADELLRRSGMSLPSEAQWEYACRAGTRTPWSCAKEELVEHANLADRRFRLAGAQSAAEDWDDRRSAHAPVGAFLANRFGLFDMHGNLGEWCADEIGGYDIPRRPEDGVRLIGDGSGLRLVRGGHWATPAALATSASRARAAPTVQSVQFGVRPMRLPE